MDSMLAVERKSELNKILFFEGIHFTRYLTSQGLTQILCNLLLLKGGYGGSAGRAALLSKKTAGSNPDREPFWVEFACSLSVVWVFSGFSGFHQQTKTCRLD